MNKTLIILAGLLPSCTVIDIGGGLDNIGKQVATPQRIERQQERYPLIGKYGKAPTPAWKKGDTYYVQLAVAYVPAKEEWLISFSPIILRNSIEFPKQLTPEEISHYPTEIFYAELNEAQFDKVCRKDIRMKQTNAMAKEEFRLIPADEVDLTGATKITNNVVRQPQRLLQGRMPERRTTGNQWRRPLVFVADVADIPLSIAATPVGWVTHLILYPFVK